jgi:hypothetical protein
MDRPGKRGMIALAALAVAAVVLLINDPIKDVVESETSGIVDRVVSDAQQNKSIVVILGNGKKVAVRVPPACVVVPGQAVRLKSLGLGDSGDAAYIYVGDKTGSET